VSHPELRPAESPPVPLSADALRWRCDPNRFTFQTSAEIEPIIGIHGQSTAVDALRFGISTSASGQNVYVRGLSGTGRMTLVRRMLDELNPACPVKVDRCYVHNFARPDRPRLISLPAGTGREFAHLMRDFGVFVKGGLGDVLASDAFAERRRTLDKLAQEDVAEITGPFEKSLAAVGLQLVQIQVGASTQAALLPIIEGRPVPPEEYASLRAHGKVTDEQDAGYAKALKEFTPQLAEVTERIQRARRARMDEIRQAAEGTVREIVDGTAAEIREKFGGDDVGAFLDEVIEDIVERVGGGGEEYDPVVLYGVNIVREHETGESCPVVIENSPTLPNLVGIVDRDWTDGQVTSDYRSIRAGSLLNADGGYLILDARDLLGEPGAWRVLVRTLRSGRLEVVPPELASPFGQPSLKPEPIDVRVRVILVGDGGVYRVLDQRDPDFSHLFKVLADFDSSIDREPDGPESYAGVIARIVTEEGLCPFDRTAVAELVEHGARIASRRGKLTARFSRVADIAREAAFLADQEGRPSVSGGDVIEAVRRTKRRADLPSRRFQELLGDGTINVQTSGSVVGQINGLAVMQAGPITYGFPGRITATIGAGRAGLIDVEAASELSGSIHTKGFHILGGLLRHRLRVNHPLAFSGSLAFEQSYGGIDGDSASGAEACCLLSALTAVPIRQGVAMTGAIDQHGRIQAIGGVNEKIEGFFDTCRHSELTGDQGVIIPLANAGDLMLRTDVVEACAAGIFSVWPVANIDEALETLMGVEAGAPDESGVYAEGSLFRLAVDRADEFWTETVEGRVGPN